MSGDRMVILGSGGARIVVAKQLRASGGIWFSLGGTRFLLDPGPGALVKVTGSRHRLDPTRLAGILLSHRHLDHSGDVNNMIEAMTMGGTEPRGVLFAPSDVLEGDDPVVLKYVRPFLKQLVTLKEGGSYELGSVRFSCPVRHQHRGEVYGFRFEVGRSQKAEVRRQKAEVGTGSSTDYIARVGRASQRSRGKMQKSRCPEAGSSREPDDLRIEAGNGNIFAETTLLHDCSADYTDSVGRGQKAEGAEGDLTTKTQSHKEGSEWSSVVGPRSSLTVSYIADTQYFPELAEHYRADVVIMNVVRPTPSQLDHLSAPDAEELVKAIRPRLAVLGHFGMKMLQAKPWVIAREMSERTGCQVVAATDGMLIDLEGYKDSSPKPQATSHKQPTAASGPKLGA